MGYFRQVVEQARRRSHLLMMVALLVGAPFFFLGGPGYHSSRSFQATWDLGHLFYFLVFTFWAHSRWSRKGKPISPFSIFAALCILVLLLGTAVEFLQMFADGRSPDSFDVLRNLLGCLVAFAFCIRPRLFAVRWRQRVFQLGVSLLIVLAIYPLARAVYDESAARRQFPVLADFETPFECDRWENAEQLRREQEYVRHGSWAARLQLTTATYSGVALFRFPRDWRDYRILHFSVYNPGQTPLQLNSRIHDTHHGKLGMDFEDRFNKAFILVPGWNDLAISLDQVKTAPRGRAMDMEHIEGFGLFVARQPRPQVIYLDHIYLDR